VSGPWARLRERSLFAKRAGAGGLLVCPGLTGYDALRDLARDEAIALPIVSHPALLGTFTAHADSGLAPAVLYGQLPRLFGADASLYPIYGSEYAMSRADCEAIKAETGAPLGCLRPIFPTAAGRLGFDRIAELCAFYGRDVLFVLGSRIRQDPGGLVQACRKFVAEIGRYAQAE
jgi:ribulose-bisphosphate carboxylase large chain